MKEINNEINEIKGNIITECQSLIIGHCLRLDGIPDHIRTTNVYVNDILHSASYSVGMLREKEVRNYKDELDEAIICLSDLYKISTDGYISKYKGSFKEWESNLKQKLENANQLLKKHEDGKE